MAGNLHTVHCFVKPPSNKGQIKSQKSGHRGNTRGGLSHLGEQAVKSSGKHSGCIFHPLSFATLIWPSLPGICPCRAFLDCIFLTPKLWGSQKLFTKVASWGHWKSWDDTPKSKAINEFQEFYDAVVVYKLSLIENYVSMRGTSECIR